MVTFVAHNKTEILAHSAMLWKHKQIMLLFQNVRSMKFILMNRTLVIMLKSFTLFHLINFKFHSSLWRHVSRKSANFCLVEKKIGERRLPYHPIHVRPRFDKAVPSICMICVKCRIPTGLCADRHFIAFAMPCVYCIYCSVCKWGYILTWKFDWLCIHYTWKQSFKRW